MIQAEMIGDKIEHQTQAVALESGAETPQGGGAAQRLGDREIRHGVGRTDELFRARRSEGLRAQGQQVRLGAGEVAGLWAGGPRAHEPDVGEAALLPGNKVLLRRGGQRDRMTEAIRPRPQPAASIDFEKQRMRHQLLRSFMAFLASDTRKMSEPFLASGGVAQ